MSKLIFQQFLAQKYIMVFAAVYFSHHALGQAIPDTTRHGTLSFVEIGGLAASSTKTPFWLRSRQYGIIPLDNPAGIVRAGTTFIIGDMPQSRRLNLKIGLESTFISNLSHASNALSTQIILPEVYFGLRLGKFEFYGGRRREVLGLMDTLMTSGSYAWSGNALPIPKIQLGTRGFIPLGFTNGILAINAFYAHGWFVNSDSIKNSYIHQKSFYSRIKIPSKKTVYISFGLNHNAQWGGKRKPDLYSVNGNLPRSFKDYLRVITASETPANDTTNYVEIDRVNRIGNHLGSIDFALEISDTKSSWFIYYQHPYEDKSGVAFKNMPDGLYGIRWQNRKKLGNKFCIRRILAEFLTTMNQSGFTINQNGQFAGADDYFNNYQYTEGWSYNKRIIGTPFFTRTEDANPELQDLRGGFGKIYIINNRIQLLHIGLSGEWANRTQVRALMSITNNNGRPIKVDPRTPIIQISSLIEMSVPINWFGGSNLVTAIGYDQGKWLPNSLGTHIRFLKYW